MPRMTNDREECPDRPIGRTPLARSHVWELADFGVTLHHFCVYCGAERWSQWIPLEETNRKEDSESEEGIN